MTLTITEQRKRNSRYFPPRYQADDDEAPHVAEGNTYDAVISALAFDPYLTRPWLAFRLNRSEDGLKRPLLKLKRAGFIKVSDAQRAMREARAENLSKPLCLELDTRGIRWMEKKGVRLVPKSTNELSHQALAAEVSVSFKAAHGKIRYVPYAELLTRPETPNALLADERPFTFKKLRYQYRKETIAKDVRFDLPVAALERTEGDEVDEFFLLGGEVDNNTEPGNATDPLRSSLERHLWEYTAIAEQRLYEKRYGFPHMYVPFVFSNAVQMRLCMRVLSEMDVPTRVKRIFVFKLHSRIPNADMAMGEWLRFSGEGFKTFSFAG